jgi:hypothetical protein
MKNGGLITPTELDKYLEVSFDLKSNNYNTDEFNYSELASPCSLDDGSYDSWLSSHQSKVHS